MMDFLYMIYIKLTSVGFLTISSGATEKFTKIQDEFEIWINGFIGLALLISVGVLMIHALKLGASGDNAQKRAQVLRDILISFVTTALLGGISTIYVLIFYFGFGLV